MTRTASTGHWLMSLLNSYADQEYADGLFHADSMGGLNGGSHGHGEKSIKGPDHCISIVQSV